MLVGRLRPDHPALPSCITSFTCFLDHKDCVVVDHAIESLASLTEMLTRGGADLTVLDADGLIAKLLGLLRVATVDPQEADPDMSQRASSVMIRHTFARVSAAPWHSHTPQKWLFLPSARLDVFILGQTLCIYAERDWHPFPLQVINLLVSLCRGSSELCAKLLAEDVLSAVESVLEWGFQGGTGGAADKTSRSLMRLVDLVLTLVFQGLEATHPRDPR